MSDLLFHISKEKRAALKFANRVRKEMGQPPRRRLSKGIAVEAGSCPISNTIMANTKIRAVTSQYNSHCDGVNYPINDPLATRFIFNFDKGQHRSLHV